MKLKIECIEFEISVEVDCYLTPKLLPLSDIPNQLFSPIQKKKKVLSEISAKLHIYVVFSHHRNFNALNTLNDSSLLVVSFLRYILLLGVYLKST